MNVNLSEKAETKIKELALQKGQRAEDLAGVLLEEKIEETMREMPRKKKLSELAGIFYGGDGKTAANAEEILISEIDKTGGFGK
jgi:ferritin-like protein